MPSLFRRPQDILRAYNDGFKGCLFSREHTEYLLSTLKYPYFKDASRRIRGSGAGKLCLPFKSVYKVSKEEPYLEAQTTGDCVSHGTRNAIDVSRAVEIDIKFESESFMALGATEGIYGSRGHGGQGMSCSGAAEWVNSEGGILLRKKYSFVDLSKYNASIGTAWGSRGVPKEVSQEAAKHQVKTISLVKNVEEVRDALANGYGVAICSGQGFSSTRDSKGYAKASGSWSHCLSAIGCNEDGDIIINNSWGPNWISGPKPEYGFPDGAFLAKADVVDRMVKSDGSYAFSNVDGFPPVDLPDYGTQEYL